EEVDERHAARQHRVAAAEDRVEQVEHLEARDHGDDEHEEDARGQQRHGDRAELPPPGGAVELRGLVQLGRDALEPGGEHDHGEAERRPQADHGDGDGRGPGVEIQYGPSMPTTASARLRMPKSPLKMTRHTMATAVGMAT